MLGDIVKHIRYSTTRCERVHSDLLVAAVLGENPHKRGDCSLGVRVLRVPGHAEIFGGVGRHQDDAPTLIQVVVGLAGRKELAACVWAGDEVELVLGHFAEVPQAHYTRVDTDDVYRCLLQC